MASPRKATVKASAFFLGVQQFIFAAASNYFLQFDHDVFPANIDDSRTSFVPLTSEFP